MSDQWRTISIFLPDGLPREQVSAELRAGVVRFAADGGEFVNDMRVEGGSAHGEGWLRWRTAYRPGPPGLRYESANEITH